MVGTTVPGAAFPGQISGLLNVGEIVSDTLVTMSDTVARSAVSRSCSDTAATSSDLLSLSRYRELADTILTVTDSTKASTNRSLVDTALAPSDSLQANFLLHRSVTDTMSTVTDTVARRQARATTDTAVTVTDTISPVAISRPAADTLATVTDSVSASTSRTIEDALTTISDAVDLSGQIQRFLTDTLAGVTDSISFSYEISVTDTATTMTDTVQLHIVMAPVDTLVNPGDTLRKTLFRELTDTIYTYGETLLSNDLYANRIRISGASGSIVGANHGATVSPGEYKPDDWPGYKNTVWYEWTPPAPGKYRFVLTPTIPDATQWTAIYVHDVVSAANLVFWNVFSSYYDADWEDINVINIDAQPGETYDIQIGSDWQVGTPRTFSFTLSWQPITLDPDYDDWPGRTVDNLETVYVNTEWCTRELGDPWSWIRLNPYWFPMEVLPSNRTAWLTVTPDVTGPASITLLDDDYAFAMYIFDGDGVTDINQLGPDRVVEFATANFGGALSWDAIAGRTYYIWLAGEDGIYGGDDSHGTMRLQWGSLVPPDNDLFDDALDLDDGIWHDAQTTEVATNENFREEPFAFSDGSQITTTQGTLWYRYSTFRFESDVQIAYRNAIGLTTFVSSFHQEVYQLEWKSQSAQVAEDTLVTMSDSVAIIPRTAWPLVDTLTTFSDSIGRTMVTAKTLTDQGVNFVDLGISGVVEDGAGTMFDILVYFSDSLRRPTMNRKISQNIFNFSGVASNTNLTVSTRKPRSTSDTFATMSDSLTGVPSVRPTDTLTTMSDTTAVATSRSMEDTLATVTDGINFPPTDTIVHMTDSIRASTHRMVTDTLVTLSDTLTKAKIQPRTASDTCTAMSDTLASSRGRQRAFTDNIVGSFAMTFTPLTKAKRLTRGTSDTITTMADGVSV